MPGSIGAGGEQHVRKGKRMGGRMGGSQVTVTNLEVIKINPETNEIFIKGAVPGARNNLLMVSGAGELIIESEIKEVAQPVETQMPEVKVEAKAPEAEAKTEAPVEVKEEVSAEPAK